MIADLARSLDDLGHEVRFVACPGSYEPPHGTLLFMRSSYGTSTPWFWECEQSAYDFYKPQILGADVVHDISHTKKIAENIYEQERRTNVVSTLLGGVYNHPKVGYNVVVWSHAMRDRALRGATDYENTPFPEMGGVPGHTGKLKDARVVPGGVDTDFYCPDGYEKDDYFLWLNRWHPAKGYHIAIELAKRTGIPLVLSGLHPDDTVHPDHRLSALEAIELARGIPNVSFKWIPRKNHHEEKRAIYRRAKALLYPVQFQEPFGLAQVEALACGTPVIGFGFGSVPEVVRHGVTGIVVPPNKSTAEVTVTGIHVDYKVTQEKLDYSVYGEAIHEVDRIDPKECRRDAVERFDRKVMAKAYIDLYRRVMNGEVWGV